MSDVLKEVREQEELIERAGDMQYAALHQRLDEDTARARALGLPEDWITRERNNYHQAYVDQLERVLQHRKNNAHRDAWRAFQVQILKAHPLCARCATDGKLRPALHVRHLIVHGGNAELMFDARLVEAVCGDHHPGRYYRPLTDGVHT